MINKFKKINNGFVKNVAVLVTGAASAQAITMIFYPFVTRIYGPEEFGVLGVFTALFMMIAPVSALTYPIAMILPKKDEDAKALAWVSLYATFIISSLLAFALFIWKEKFLGWIGSEKIIDYVYLIPVGVFFAGLLQISEQWLIREHQFKITAKAAVVKSIIVGSMQTGFGFIKPVGGALIVSSIVGWVVHATILMGFSIKTYKDKKANKKIFNDSCGRVIKAKDICKEYSSFPIFRAPQVLINTVSLSICVIMLASYSGPISAGYYSIAITVLGMPSFLIGKSVGDVFYPKITEAHLEGKNVTKLIIKATGALLILGLFPLLIIVSCGPYLFSIVFGHEWSRAGEFAQWLALWFFMSLAARPAIAAVSTINLQGIFLIHEVIALIIRVVALYIGFELFDDVYSVIIIFSVINFFIYAFLIFIVVYKSMLLNKTPLGI